MLGLHLLKFRFRRARRDAKPTFFLHIPKCAGSSLWEVIWDIYGTRNVYLAKSKEHHARLAAMPLEKRRGYSAIGGHGSLRLFRNMLGDMDRYHKITTLRDPIDRVISEYNYIRMRPQYRLNAVVAAQGIEGFIKNTVRANRQVKLLTGQPDDVEGAVETVETFFDDWCLSNDVAQMTERLYEVTGTKARPPAHKNRATSAFSRRDLPPAMLRVLEEQNRHDLALIEALRSTRP